MTVDLDAIAEVLAKATAAMREYATFLLRFDLDMVPTCPDADLAELADSLDAAPAWIAETLALRAEVKALREGLLSDAAVEAAAAAYGAIIGQQPRVTPT
jgi:hypothetical protein